jgi:hypothetical protein
MKLTSGEQIIFITATCPHHDEEWFTLETATFTVLVVSAGGTTSKRLNYDQVQSTSGGPEAIALFKTNPDAPISFNQTRPLKNPILEPEGREALPQSSKFQASESYFVSLPSLLSTLTFKWSKWEGWFRRRDIQSSELPGITLRPPYQSPSLS